MGESQIEAFVAHYGTGDAAHIAFAWNGLHADEFWDRNENFRSAVLAFVMERPGRASTQLIRDLYLAESAWAKEAWAASRAFAGLAGLLLLRGGAAELATFAEGMMTSFDTFGACHLMELPPETLRSLLQEAERQLAEASDERQRRLLGEVQELLKELKAKTAADGWVRLKPGTAVSNVRVVSRWRLHVRGLVARLRRLLG